MIKIADKDVVCEFLGVNPEEFVAAEVTWDPDADPYHYEVRLVPIKPIEEVKIKAVVLKDVLEDMLERIHGPVS